MGLATGMSSGIILRTPTGNRSPGDMGAHAWWHVLGDASLRDDGDESTYTGPIADRGTASGVWRVSQWDDMTGNGRHAVEAVAADQPEVLDSDTGTSGDAIKFTVSGGDLRASFTSLSQPYTVWMVYRQLSNNTGVLLWSGVSSGSSFKNDGGTSMAAYAGSSQTIWDSVILTHSAFSVVMNGASSTGRSNNASRKTVAGSVGTNTLTDGLVIGGRHDDIGHPLAAYIDIAVFNRALTSAEELELYAYAQDTHGIT